MKKIILSLAMAAFIAGGSFAIATTSTSTDTMEMTQDGKKKAKATKKVASEKKADCGDTKATSDCGDKKVGKKSCCSDGKTTKAKTTKPEKK